MIISQFVFILEIKNIIFVTDCSETSANHIWLKSDRMMSVHYCHMFYQKKNSQEGIPRWFHYYFTAWKNGFGTVAVQLPIWPTYIHPDQMIISQFVSILRLEIKKTSFLWLTEVEFPQTMLSLTQIGWCWFILGIRCLLYTSPSPRD